MLTDKEREQLKRGHKQERDGRLRERIKTVLLTDKGWSSEAVAEALLDFFGNSLWLGKLMIFEQIYWQILRAYVTIWSKNLTIKMPKTAIFSTKASFQRSLLEKSLCKAYNELLRLQSIRQGINILPPISVDVNLSQKNEFVL